MSDGRDALDDSLDALAIGDHVRDRDEPDTRLVVVGTPLERAATYQIDADGTTVADANPGYPAADHVVEVVFPDDAAVDIDHAQRYAYPRERLERVTPVQDREGVLEVTDGPGGFEVKFTGPKRRRRLRFARESLGGWCHAEQEFRDGRWRTVGQQFVDTVSVELDRQVADVVNAPVGQEVRGP